MGKSAVAKALIHELGVCPFSGLVEYSAANLSIEEVRRLFGQTFRLRPMTGSQWHVLLVEELELIVSKHVNAALKDELGEQHMPERLIVVATSNDASGLDEALLRRSRCSRSPPAPRLRRRARSGWRGSGSRRSGQACPCPWVCWAWASTAAGTSPCTAPWPRWAGPSKSTEKGWWPHENRGNRSGGHRTSEALEGAA